MGADRWHRETWHRLTIAERRELQRAKHDQQFVVREYRCLRCAIVVDTSSRRGHLSRCSGLSGRLLDQADLALHFTEVADKGAGWQVDATAPVGVQQSAGGLMDAGTSENGNGAAEVTPADKRAWATTWVGDQASPPTAVALIAAVKSRFGTGVSNRVAAQILKAVKGSKRDSKPRELAAAATELAHGRVDVPSSLAMPGIGAGVVGLVLDALQAMRQLGVESFKLAGREYSVR